MFRKIRALFAWHLVKPVSNNINWYYENSMTGDRMVVCPTRCFCPVNWDWMFSGRGKSLYRDQFGDWVDAKGAG